YVGQLRMIPIVVNDSRGFYTSRVFQTFIHEGMAMLEDGVAPALIENAARQAGFPVGPLTLTDEVTVELPWKIVQQAIEEEGDRFVKPCAYNVMRRMLEELKRPGRKNGAGFYEYPEGGKKYLWPGLKEAFPLTAEQPSVEEVKARYLTIQALETALPRRGSTLACYRRRYRFVAGVELSELDRRYAVVHRYDRHCGIRRRMRSHGESLWPALPAIGLAARARRARRAFLPESLELIDGFDHRP